VKIIYTLHTLERMRQRGIDKELVALCVQSPDKREEVGGVYRYVRKINDKVIFTMCLVP